MNKSNLERIQENIDYFSEKKFEATDPWLKEGYHKDIIKCQKKYVKELNRLAKEEVEKIINKTPAV